MAKQKLIGRSSIPAPVAYNSRRGLTASAMRIDLGSRDEKQELAAQAARSKQWQDDAWRVSDAIGEIKFAYGMVASIMSRLRLYPAYVEDPESAPIPLTDAAEIKRPDSEGTDADEQVYHRAIGLTPQQALYIRDLYHSQMANSSVPSILRNFALNINTPGEGYLTLIDNEWSFKSKDEVRVQTDGVKMFRTPTSLPKDLPDSVTIGRVWREHPRYSYDADSSLRSLIDDCDELLLISKVIRTNARSRLNAGILYVSDEVTASRRTETDDPEVEAEEEVDLEKELYEAMSAGILSEDAANTIIPLLFRGPGEADKMLKHIQLERPIDEFLVKRAEAVLDRILQGLDVPKDLVTGLAHVKYSNATHINESLYKAHIEPLALVICDAFTDIILRPLLRAKLASEQQDGNPLGWTDEVIAKIVIWYDPSEVVTRPDRAADALALYNNKELSGAALRGAYGFGENDAPDEQELARRLALAGLVPEGAMNILLQSVLPTVLKKLAAADGPGGALPSSLQDALGGGSGGSAEPDPAADPSADPGLDSTIPGDSGPAAAPTAPTQAAPAASDQPPAPSVPAGV